ncbi:MAG TPA: PKD domain-containing protein [Thermoleophilaceae bacterium]|nr:PKD domain-containing protein [Thermoleophilaceae bacterium]
MTRRARIATAAVVAALPLAGAASDAATPKKSKDFAFTSKGTAINPQATGDSDDPTTYEDFPFTIKDDELNGTINVHIDWLSPADDWDLYVYRKSGAKLQTIGQSASAPPGNEENAVADSQGIPWKAGQYVVRVVNYTAAVPNFEGTVKFGPFQPYNQIPIAKLSAKKHVRKGKPVTLDASASHDPDGTIRNYRFDLDGNGSMEVNNGRRPRLTRVLAPGTHHVAVRVTDNEGLRAYANRTIVVGK